MVESENDWRMSWEYVYSRLKKLRVLCSTILNSIASNPALFLPENNLSVVIS